MKRRLIMGLALALAGLSGCSYVPRVVTEYRIDVQQGNVLTQEMVSQLRPGLTRDQVRFILGTPMLVDMFHADRWDYIYRLEKGRTREVESRRLTVFFDKDDLLTRVAGDVVAEGAALAGAAADATTGPAAVTNASTPESRNRVIDLGEAPAGGMPPVSERGFFGRVLEKVGF